MSINKLNWINKNHDEYMASIDTCIRDVDYNKMLQHHPAGDFVDAYTRSCVYVLPWACIYAATCKYFWCTHAVNTYKYFLWWVLVHVMMAGPSAPT